MNAAGPSHAVILAGGAARRAGGVNKSFMLVEGRPIIEHQLERLRPEFQDRISIITDREADFRPLDLRCIPDVSISGIGNEKSSLRGLASALSAFPESWLFVLAGDMPWPDMDVMRAQWELLRTNHEIFIASRLSRADVGSGEPTCKLVQTLEKRAYTRAKDEPRSILGVCLSELNGPEPFHAIYHGSLAASAITRLKSAAARQSDEPRRTISLRDWIADTPDILILDRTAIEKLSMDGCKCLTNFNSPEEAQGLRASGGG